MDCVLMKLETQGFVNEHLQPQSFELFYGVQGNDIGIHLVDMKSNIDNVMEQIMGVPNATALERKQSRRGDVAFEKFHLDEEVLLRFRERICRLYEVDVTMLQETGITTTMCL